MIKMKRKKVSIKHVEKEEYSVEDPIEDSAVEEVEEIEDGTVDLRAWSDPLLDESMESLFFIIAGNYNPNKHKISVIEEDGERSTFAVGGYDPKENETRWFSVRDKVTFNTIYAGPDLERGLENVKRCIKRHNNNPDSYLEEVRKVNQPISNPMRRHYRIVYEVYGGYYSSQIAEKEVEALSELKERKKKIRSTLSRAKRKDRGVRLKVIG